MERPLILDAARTPFGRYRGGLAGVRVDDLAALPITELLRRHPLDPARVDDVLLGNANGAGEENRDVGRMAALLAGLPPTVPGAAVNRLCGSGGEAIVQAARAVALGDASLVVAGGVEGMTRAPFVVPRPDRPFADRLEPVSTTVGWRLVNRRMRPEWTVSMGRAAEEFAVDLGLTREDMDLFALRSHRRASAAWDAGVHEGFAFTVHLGDGTAVRRDECVRPGTTLERLARLESAYSEKGPVTAGNSSPLGDGATALLVGSEAAAAELGLEPLAEVLGSAVTAVEPHRFPLAPVTAIRKLMTRLKVSGDDVDLWEINEAFAATTLSVLHHLPEADREKVNVHGGAIAYGHPLSASLARVIADLARHLRARGGGLGIAVAAIAVGQALAVAVRS
ncbi:thiolase family protein [Saccharothrix violaceirubra]|uniref:Probable acetyl-CoA acetyltransferase n=1 Tax=Saccharothrix violaceirubra TaxID=413306 RepID=A0A7W7T9G8_9PSEU|nr:thiolase family protein [Saccharothrix violaceirubra]MBB4969043.1 acetyl-CoA acyltransferase [Saccharothrix violaceirubra]